MPLWLAMPMAAAPTFLPGFTANTYSHERPLQAFTTDLVAVAELDEVTSTVIVFAVVVLESIAAVAITTDTMNNSQWWKKIGTFAVFRKLIIFLNFVLFFKSLFYFFAIKCMKNWVHQMVQCVFSCTHTHSSSSNFAVNFWAKVQLSSPIHIFQKYYLPYHFQLFYWSIDYKLNIILWSVITVINKIEKARLLSFLKRIYWHNFSLYCGKAREVYLLWFYVQVQSNKYLLGSMRIKINRGLMGKLMKDIVSINLQQRV